MSDGAMQEIGCPHDFGVVYHCPHCGSPRDCSTSNYVTERYNREHPGEGGYSWPPAFDEKLRRSWWRRLLLHLAGGGVVTHSTPASGAGTDSDLRDLLRDMTDWVGLVEQPAYGTNSIYDELVSNFVPRILAAASPPRPSSSQAGEGSCD